MTGWGEGSISGWISFPCESLSSFPVYSASNLLVLLNDWILRKELQRTLPVVRLLCTGGGIGTCISVEPTGPDSSPCCSPFTLFPSGGIKRPEQPSEYVACTSAMLSRLASAGMEERPERSALWQFWAVQKSVGSPCKAAIN